MVSALLHLDDVSDAERWHRGSMNSDHTLISRLAALAGLTLCVFSTAGCATRSGPPAALPAVGSPPPVAAPLPPLTAAEWARQVLYFAIVDRFADGDPSNNAGVDRQAKGAFHGGDLKGLTARLDDLADLGVTALWITPLVANIPGFVTGAGFPDWGYHGYWADDFHRLDPRFGSEADLAELVTQAHRRGIRVLLDIVYNHPGYHSRYLADPRTKGWLRSEDRGDCGQDDLTLCLAGLPDFKTDLPEVRDDLMSAHLGLAKRVGLDGFRLDTVKHVEHDFWQEHRRRVRAELGERFFLIGEVWGGDAQVLEPYFANDEMDAGFDFGFQGSALGFVQGRGRAVAFDRYLKSREKVRAGYLLSHFLSSHDVPGGLHLLNGDRARFRLAAFLQMTVAGLPMVYYGEEVARAGGDWPENRSPMPWGERAILPGQGLPVDETMRQHYRRLIALRREWPVLATGRHESLLAEGDLLVFARRGAAAEELALVAVNRGEQPAAAKIAAPAEWRGRNLIDAFGGQPVRWLAEGQLEIALPPLGGAVVIAAPAPTHPNSGI